MVEEILFRFISGAIGGVIGGLIAATIFKRRMKHG